LLTTIGTHKIASLEYLVPYPKDKQEYIIYNIELVGDTLKYHGFYSSKVSQSFKKTCKLRKWLKTNVDNKDIYSPERIYTRMYFEKDSLQDINGLVK